MADYLQILKGEELVRISADFNYVQAVNDMGLVGLKLMPMVKTDNLKVAIYELTKGNEVPVIALVHAFDSEARIGDRPNYEEFKAQLFLIKDKINQGEELRKKIKDMGMSSDEQTILNSIYDDISNEISKILVGFERRACEALCKAKLHIDENDIKFDVDYKLSADNKIDFSGWNDPTHDIIGDLVTLQKAAKNKIKRQIVSSKVLGYILNNAKLNTIASNDPQQGYLTQDYALAYIMRIVGIEITVDDRTFRTSYLNKDGSTNTQEYRFFDENVVISLTTLNEVGKTLMTSTPAEDANVSNSKYGLIAVTQWKDVGDPWTSWTEVEGVGLPVFNNINGTLYLSTITEG